MHPKLAIFSSALFFLLTQLAQGQPAESAFPYTLQVASFPDAALAEQYAERLSRAGEVVGFGMVDLAGRGHWTRVYVGSFKTPAEARQYGDALMGRMLIEEYLVKTARDLQLLGRPHTVNRQTPPMDQRAPQAAAVGAAPGALFKQAASLQMGSNGAAGSANTLPGSAKPKPAVMLVPPQAISSKARGQLYSQPGMNQQQAGLLIPLPDMAVTLPVANDLQLHLAPAMDRQAIPRPDPVYLAFNLISESRSGRGGLWVSGDREEALARLCYIIGGNSELIDFDDQGAVQINRRRLAEVAGANQVPAEEAPLRIAEYITTNEGLLLLVELTQGAHRYLLHIGRRAPSLNGVFDVVGGVNLDNNYDSRINPYRRNGGKLDIERPPQGYDSMVAMNPAARWFNLHSNEFVPAGQITFHELAEAHAKVVFNLDYLEQDGRPGAHNIALEREKRLKTQRPSANVVLTLGSNRLFKSEEEVRHFYAPTGHAVGQPR